MADVATYVRIFEAEPSDDFVTKRTAAVKALSARLVKDVNVDPLIGIADGIVAACNSMGIMPDPLSSLTEAALKSQSTSFVSAGNESQMLVTAMLALDHQLVTAKPSTRLLSISDVLALTAWSAFSFQSPRSEPKLETLRKEIETHAREVSVKTASQARTRANVSDLKIGEVAADLSDIKERLQSSLDLPLTALRSNAALDREEIEFLWWVLGDYSDLLDAPIASLTPTVAAIAASLDASRMLRRPPCEAHKQLLRRHVRNHDSLTLEELLASLGDAKSRLNAVSISTRIDKFPRVFPLLAALRSGVLIDGADQSRTMTEWSARALLEGGILRVLDLLPEAKI